jgi:hypothetical protein
MLSRPFEDIVICIVSMITTISPFMNRLAIALSIFHAIYLFQDTKWNFNIAA